MYRILCTMCFRLLFNCEAQETSHTLVDRFLLITCDAFINDWNVRALASSTELGGHLRVIFIAPVSTTSFHDAFMGVGGKYSCLRSPTKLCERDRLT